MEVLQKQQETKNRDYLFDNLKGISIFLVVFGHLIEQINSPFTITIYKIIYLFHMPLFIFISGYFARYNFKKIATKILLPYIIFQTLFTIFEIIFSSPQIDVLYILKPKWIMWFLFALFLWKMSIFFIEKIKKALPIIIVISIIISLVFGFLKFDGYVLSLSRTVVFYPYFLIGYYFKQINFLNINFFKSIHTKVCFAVFAVASIVTHFALFSNVSEQGLYGALNYWQLSNYGVAYRLYGYICAMLIIMFLMLVMSKNKNIFSLCGRESFIIYILHAPIVKLLEIVLKKIIPPYSTLLAFVFAILIIVFILFLKKLYIKIKNRPFTK